MTGVEGYVIKWIFRFERKIDEFEFSCCYLEKNHVKSLNLIFLICEKMKAAQHSLQDSWKNKWELLFKWAKLLCFLIIVWDWSSKNKQNNCFRIKNLKPNSPLRGKEDEAITRAHGNPSEPFCKGLRTVSLELRHPVWNNANTAMFSWGWTWQRSFSAVELNSVCGLRCKHLHRCALEILDNTCHCVRK